MQPKSSFVGNFMSFDRISKDDNINLAGSHLGFPVNFRLKFLKIQNLHSNICIL